MLCLSFEVHRRYHLLSTHFILGRLQKGNETIANYFHADRHQQPGTETQNDLEERSFIVVGDRKRAAICTGT